MSITFSGVPIGNLSYNWGVNKNKTGEGITGTMSGYGFDVGTSRYDDEDRLVWRQRDDNNLDQAWNLSLDGDDPYGNDWVWPWDDDAKWVRPFDGPGSGPVLIAGGACTIIALDETTLDPTDLCPPKHVCYAVIGCAAFGTIDCMSGGDDDVPWEKIKDLYEQIKGLRAMQEYFNTKAQEAIQAGDMDRYQYYLDRINEIAEQIEQILEEIETLGGEEDGNI